MKRMYLIAFLLVFAPPLLMFAENGALSINTRYCIGDSTDIFTGIAHNDDGSPKITVDVDPDFRVKIKKDGYVSDLPVTPVYDLVVTAIPIINHYCLPQWDENNVFMAPVAPPDILPFKGEIIIGDSPITKERSIFVIGPGQFKLAGKTEQEEWKYEWKLNGWPNGITDEAQMLRLFKAMDPNSGEQINVRMEIVRPNKQTTFEIAQVPFEGCKQLTQSTETKKGEIVWGRKKIITLQGVAIPFVNPLDKWMKELIPGSVTIPGLSSVKNNTRDLIAEINANLNKGYNVLAVGHSFGAIVAFNLKERFKNTCAEFLFLDPPHDILLSKISLDMQTAEKGGIAENLNTVNWTNGKAWTHFFTHTPFTFKRFQKNKDNLKALKKIILDWESSKKEWIPPDVNKKVGISKDNISLFATALLAQSDASSNTPIITKLSSPKGSAGSSIKISGRNFGTQVIVYFENDSGGFSWQEGLPVKKENGLDTVTYTIPSEMSAVAITADGEGGEIVTKPVSLGSYSISLSGSDENAFGSDPVAFMVMGGIVGNEESVEKQPPSNLDDVSDESIFDTISVDLKVNGKDGPITVEKRDRVVLSWISEGATRCRANWSRNDIKLAGTAAGRLSRSVTIRAACINAEGERADDAVQVIVDTESS